MRWKNGHGKAEREKRSRWNPPKRNWINENDASESGLRRWDHEINSTKVSIKFISSVLLHVTQKARRILPSFALITFSYRIPRFSFILNAQEKLTEQFCGIIFVHELHISRITMVAVRKKLWEIALDDSSILFPEFFEIGQSSNPWKFFAKNLLKF